MENLNGLNRKEALEKLGEVLLSMSDEWLLEIYDKAILAEWMLNTVRCRSCSRFTIARYECPHESGIGLSIFETEEEY
jgi:hypothetical protein